MQTQLLDSTGKVQGKISLAKEIFGLEANPRLIVQTVRIYLANSRQASAKTKSRGEVTGSGRKIWRQKGTGRARHGDRYAPIFVGGGIAHGPRGLQNYKLRLAKKMRRTALFSLLSQKVKDQELLVIDDMEKMEPKTKIMDNKFKGLLKQSKKEISKLSIVVTNNCNNLKLGTRNLSYVSLLPVNDLNAHQVINSGLLIFSKNSLKDFQEIYIPESKTVASDKPTAPSGKRISKAAKQKTLATTERIIKRKKPINRKAI